ncbi:hypothetical protein CW304_30960 [Bacillus sp. UFRGS-B20]|nr:hypothetical protein CW304_30960 [Bacillus sp. UFRGS-B20]
MVIYFHFISFVDITELLFFKRNDPTIFLLSFNLAEQKLRLCLYIMHQYCICCTVSCYLPPALGSSLYVYLFIANYFVRDITPYLP